MSVFTNCQKTAMFQTSNDQNFVSQLAEPNFSYMRLYENNCNIPLFLQIDNSLNFLTQSTQFMQTVLKCDNAILYANTMAIMKNFVVSKKINYICMASSQNRFVLPGLPITIDLSEYKKVLCFLYKGKKALYGSFIKMNGSWILVPLSTLLCLSLTLLI